MNSDTKQSAQAEHIGKTLRRSNTARIAALTAVAVIVVIAGPPGLATGPSPTNTSASTLLSGNTAVFRAQIETTRISFELIETTDTLSEESSSYAERRVGPLSFPDGAINVPWGPSIGSTTGRAYPASEESQTAGAGQTITAPRLEGALDVLNVALRPGPSDADTVAAIDAVRTSVAFDQTSTHLSQDAEDSLDQLAAQLLQGDFRIQLRAFGGSASDRSHNARRLALRRALAVRNHLMERGVSQDRMIVRALGGAVDGGPANRVDVVAATS